MGPSSAVVQAGQTHNFWASFLFGAADATAELDLPSHALMYSATAAESLHCGKQMGLSSAAAQA